MSPTTVTTPTMDYIVPTTFQYIFVHESRGVFDDFMWFQWLNLRRRDKIGYPEPHQVVCLTYLRLFSRQSNVFKIPIMLGAGFAIRRDYFNDLGQYDEGELMIS